MNDTLLWEQKAFLFINTPFRMFGTLVMLLQKSVYGVILMESTT